MGAPADNWPQGEDCLNLIVTAPSPLRTARPVVVWFHGGGYSSGSGLLNWYDPSKLTAEGDVVCVSINYRLGVFGFLQDAVVSPGNLGLLDQLAALRWVQNNIHRYGGMPIT
jgi:para-nitrobenzyl esterase